MASSTSSLPRASPRPSPSNSLQKPNASLDTLIAYLVAAKRSLASIHLVHRATSVLSDARAAVESTTVLLARTAYLRRSLASQLKILRGVQYELEAAAHNIQAEFKSVLKELDAADKRLEQSLETLRNTRVEDGFKTARTGANDGGDTAEPKDTLHDFVDDKPVEELRDDLKSAIDRVQQTKEEMDKSIQTLEDDLQSINNTLSDRTASSSSTRSDLQPINVANLLKTLETHAKEMAEGLESLVKHFDLCVSAIKHTEGGGDAVAENFDTDDLPAGVGVGDFEAPAQPMTEEDRVEMMQVLETDAGEVDDVVIELQDRSAEMDAQLEQVMAWKEKSESSYNDVAEAFKLLEKVGSQLSGYVAESSRFSTRWAEEKTKIEDGMAGMEDLREVYQNFSQAYDGLIIEVARRKSVKKQMEKVAQEAQMKLEKLYEEDLALRDAFRIEQGDFLPSDIWYGLASLPPRFAFSRVDDDDGSVPELPRERVEEAYRRTVNVGRPNT